MNITPSEKETLTEPAVRKKWYELEDSNHLVQFYESQEFLLQSLSEFVDAGLSAGDSCIVIAIQPHLIELEQILKQKGHDLFSRSATGEYMPFDAAETLSKFMVDDLPDSQLFRAVIAPVIERAANGNRRVRIFGEMVALLWAEAKFDAAIRVEECWNELARTYPFTLCCSYPIQEFDSEVTQPIASVCENHSVIVPGESYATASTAHHRFAVIATLQQKAKALEREVAERKEVEQRLCASEIKYRRLKDQLEHQLNEHEQLFQRELLARLEAQSANRMKDEFLAIVSHELRTPLTSLFGWTRLLRSANLDPDSVSRALEAIERSVQSQRQLVEDLLDVSKIMAGKLQLHMSPVAVESVIETALQTIQPSAAAKSISIRVHLDSQPTPIQADPNRLQQVIWNLLSNAIKFTPSGGSVDVCLSFTKSNVIISVKDTGEGIGKEFLPFVFDRFRQADTTITRKHGGLGLGLAIVRHLVELHDGTVHAESDGKGKGATFNVTLPYVPQASRLH